MLGLTILTCTNLLSGNCSNHIYASLYSWFLNWTCYHWVLMKYELWIIKVVSSHQFYYEPIYDMVESISNFSFGCLGFYMHHVQEANWSICLLYYYSCIFGQYPQSWSLWPLIAFFFLSKRRWSIQKGLLVIHLDYWNLIWFNCHVLSCINNYDASLGPFFLLSHLSVCRRISMAGLSTRTIPHLADAIHAAVTKAA